jgi:SAM-dependent methyltransferase
VSPTGSITFNAVCEFEDFANPDLAATIRDVFRHEVPYFTPEFPKGAEYRKYWEVGMSVLALRQLGSLRPDAEILGVGAGTETTIFYLTNHVRRVFATDLYLSAGRWDQSAPWHMLVSPDRFAPYPFRRDQLVVQHMDGRLLDLPDNTFDCIFSSGSIEHFGSMQSIASSAYEMGRVLKPGGVLTVSTEYRISGPEGGDGWDGLRFFSRDALRRYIVEASGLEPVDEFDASLSEATMASQREFSFYAKQSDRALAKQGRFPRVAEVIWSEYPHLVLTDKGYVFGSVHLALRKTDRYPVVDNGWAKPSAELIASIRAAEASLQLGSGGFVRRGVSGSVRVVRKGIKRAVRW